MRTIIAFLSLLVLVVSQSARAADPVGEPFIVGIAPHTSARVIVAQYQPVRQALEQALGRPVEIVTAPDFTEFARRALAQTYDIAVTTGHQAELLRADAAYEPLITYQANFLAVVVVARDAPFRKPTDLNNKVVLGLNPSSLVTLWGQHWLRDNQVTPKLLNYVSAADSVAQLILSGDASAGFMSLANFQKLPQAVQDSLRMDAQSQPMAGRVYVLNRRDIGLLKAVQKALNAFGESPAGKTYFLDNKLEGYRPITAAELQSMAPFADEVRQVLRSEAR